MSISISTMYFDSPLLCSRLPFYADIGGPDQMAGPVVHDHAFRRGRRRTSAASSGMPEIWPATRHRSAFRRIDAHHHAIDRESAVVARLPPRPNSPARSTRRPTGRAVDYFRRRCRWVTVGAVTTPTISPLVRAEFGPKSRRPSPSRIGTTVRRTSSTRPAARNC